MAKKKKTGFFKKATFLFFIAVVICAVYILQHFGIIAFSGEGGLGFGTASVQPTISQLPEVLSFHFNNDKIYYEKNNISMDQFKEFVAKAEKAERRLNLYFVEANTSNEFYKNIKDFIAQKKVYISENRITEDKMNK